ncbi:NHL repeat-containing protein [Devosia sp. CAU 1758]
MKTAPAEIITEYGPYPGVSDIHGVTYDGSNVWFASGEKLNSVDPETGAARRSIDATAYAGTAFDGTHLFQIAEDRINRIDPESGTIVASIPTPGDGASGLAWAEGALWVGEYRARRIYQVDPGTGAVQRTIEATRFVTGVTWVDGELWHGTWEDDRSDLRHIDAQTAEVLEILEMPAGAGVSGLESNGADRFYCGGGSSGMLRVVRRPQRRSA